MDIKLPLNNISLATLGKLTNQSAILKIGQQFDAQVLNTALQAGNIAITLKLGNDTLTLHSDQPVSLASGQHLQLQVFKVSPLEFKVVNPQADFKLQTPPTIASAAPTNELRLTPIPNATAVQTVEVKVVGVSGNNIQLQPVLNSAEQSTDGPSVKTAIFTVERSQLQQWLPTKANTVVNTNLNTPQPSLLASDTLKIGQHLTLELAQTGVSADFKIVSGSGELLNQQVNELVKQLLPKHEAPPVLLNQLIKDLPQLLNNNHLPTLLKTVAASILENLPAKEQLASGVTIKHALNNSGLLLEAKLASALDEEIDLNTDFKANLLKLVHLLKQEVNSENQQKQDLPDMDILKNLQQKTENTLAKIALEQLNTLPKDENDRQSWSFEIPFINNGHAETANIQIHRDQDKEKQSGPSTDWSVTITVTPPGLGTIHCAVVFQNKIINTYFKSQKTDTSALITTHLDDLKKQFEASGLTPGQLVSQQGAVKAKPAHRLLTNKLFDEQV